MNKYAKERKEKKLDRKSQKSEVAMANLKK